MKLFIANTTKHVQEFLYRVPENDRVFRQIIPIGSQVLIYQDSTSDVLEYIVKQHTDTPKPFCVPVSESAKHKDFVGLIYSFDKPVPDTKIEHQFEINDEALKEMGAEQRKEAAAAMSVAADQGAEEAGGKVNSLEMSVVEVGKKNDPNSSTSINEKISVVKDKRK